MSNLHQVGCLCRPGMAARVCDSSGKWEGTGQRRIPYCNHYKRKGDYSVVTNGTSILAERHEDLNAAITIIRLTGRVRVLTGPARLHGQNVGRRARGGAGLPGPARTGARAGGRDSLADAAAEGGPRASAIRA